MKLHIYLHGAPYTVLPCADRGHAERLAQEFHAGHPDATFRIEEPPMRVARDGATHPTIAAEMLLRARIAADLMAQANGMQSTSVVALTLRAIAMDIAEGVVGKKVTR